MTRAEKLKFIASRTSVIDAVIAMVERHGAKWLTGGQVDQIYSLEKKFDDLEHLLAGHQEMAA